MGYCPNCEYEYVVGVERCPDCNRKLVDNLGEVRSELKDFEIVYTTDRPYEAEMIKANLETNGIKSFILGQKDSSYPTVGNLAVVKLLVHKDDVASALDYLSSIDNEENDIE